MSKDTFTERMRQHIARTIGNERRMINGVETVSVLRWTSVFETVQLFAENKSDNDS